MFFISSTTTKEEKQVFTHLMKKIFSNGYKFHADFTLPTEDNSMFVFGSNLQGLHYGGSAKVAHEKFGAEMFVGFGATGGAYALPTCKEPGSPGSMTLDEIQEYVVDLMEFAEMQDDTTFFITRCGCGVAGFTDAQIAPLFKGFPDNADFPEEWKPYLVA